MENLRTAFVAGEHVVVRDERWTVLRAEPFDQVLLLHLRGCDRENRGAVQSVLLPFDRARLFAAARRLRARRRRRVLGAAAGAVADAVEWRECWSAIHAHLDIRAWQLEPAVAASAGAMRVLLADAVGLGKTIQAGLIMTELVARGLASRVLVLTPASIRAQWADELRARFGLSPVVFDHATLATVAASLPHDINPWATAPVIVSSIDLVKRPEVRTALDETGFDVLVVDEAHHLTPGSDRAAVVGDVARRTPWVVLITATPHSGEDHAYQALLATGQVAGDPIHIFRRTRGGVEGPRRRSRLLRVRPTPAEHALLDAVWHYQRARVTARASPGARLVASVIARRAASSPAAAARTLARRLALLGGARPEPSHPALPWDDSADEADDVADALLAPAGLGDPALEREWTTRLLALARAASHAPSKVAAVRRLLRRTSECVLIFSEYRDVVSELVAALADLTSIAAIHGALSPRERQRAVEAFTAGTVRTLVATDAAGEGLNLHARCRLVVNLELPWMPRRLEQRIGRVDRLGQRRPVHAVQLAHRGVFEGTVIARLERRRASAAGRLSTPHDTAEGATITAVRRQCAKWSAEHQTQDAIYQPHAPHAPAGRCTRPAAVLMFSTPIRAASGHLVQRHVTALQIDVGTTRHLTRRLVRRLIQDERVRCALRDDVHAHVVALSPPLAAAGAAIARRHTALLAALELPRGRRLYQASLFDSRGEQQARRAAARQSAWCAHVRRQQQAATELHDLHAGAPEFVAAWIGAR